jgi:PAS domain S-box-containing protein
LADARYTELADTIGVGTYTAREPNHFSQVNGALVRMLGYSSERELLDLDLSKNLLFANTKKFGWDTLSQANALWRRKDGRPLVVQVHARALRDADGEVIACRGFVVDRTEAQAIEEALSRTQKLDAVGRLAGGVAHDFNNLLTIILSSLELLAVRPNDPTILRDAMEATDQAAQLIRRLLAFGRRQVHHAEPVEVGATALRTSEMLSRSLGSKHKLDTSKVTSGLWTNMDVGQLEQVLVNLVLNAKDAMAEGGTIEISSSVMKRGEQDGVQLVVKDTGHGMKPEDKARIFEPFFTTREPGRGTGLGLSTVHGIVMQAGGFIDVESEVGKGSRFTLWFPVTSAPDSAEKKAASPQAKPPGKKVLVVDDEPVIRRTVCRMLEAAGHETREAGSGNQAIALFTQGERFDVMLSDVRMPDGDGPTAAARVRALAPSTRVVLMSGYQDHVDEDTQAGADAFVAKPFTRGVLLAAVEGETVLRVAG